MMGRKLPTIISEKEFLEGLKKVKGQKLKLAFMLGFYQCMRVSEIAGLKKAVSKCCRADLIKIKKKGEFQKLQCSKCKKFINKNDIRRHPTEWQIKPLTKDCVDIDRGFIHIKQAKGSKDRDIPIMPPVKHGLRFLPVKRGIRSLEKRMKKYYPGHHFHTFRHSGATHYLNELGIDIRQIQTLLGHSRLDSTQIYTHVTPKSLQKVFEKAWKEVW